ncbi:hypothetical protein GCM10025869_25520 [Homoserinibacter gongjuensis]|uniref:Divalent metal cation transporter MntH n=1 Tax=Homoserinibacter gongjuensis TaxID=1162968 RepID=A0ABQ6JUP3_9MICO|nr:hypothetical protein GCM10025869_25520 [Homoserinibacter gongjuensis]
MVVGLVAIIAIGFCAGLVVAPVDPAATVAGLVPRFTDAGSVLLAASILGATVMPHAIYAHSALTRDRFGGVPEGPHRQLVLRATRIDVTIALAIAGTVNLVILLLAAATLPGVAGTDTLEGRMRRSAPLWDWSWRPSSRWGCWHPGSRRPPWAPTPAPRSCRGCCGCGCRCSCGGS